MFYILIGIVAVLSIGFGLDRLFFYRPKKTNKFHSRFAWSLGLIGFGIGCLLEPTKLLATSLALNLEVGLAPFSFGYAIGQGIVLGLISNIIGLLLDLMFPPKKKSLKEQSVIPVPETTTDHQVEKSFEKTVIDDEKFYAKAAREIESEKQVKGLWAKAQVLTEGDIGKAQLKYIELRVQGLIENEKKKSKSHE